MWLCGYLFVCVILLIERCIPLPFLIWPGFTEQFARGSRYTCPYSRERVYCSCVSKLVRLVGGEWMSKRGLNEWYEGG